MTIIGKENISRAQKIGFTIGAVVLCGVLVWWYFRPPLSMVEDAPLPNLKSSLEGLRAYDENAKAAKQARASQLREALWTQQRIADFRAKLPAKWEMREGGSESKPHVIIRRFVLTRTGATAKEWNDIYNFLQNLSSLPGVVVYGLTIQMPRPETRKFEPLEVIVGFPTKNPEANSIALQGAGN